MKLFQTGDTLKFELDWLERLAAFHFSQFIEVKLSNIIDVSTEGPKATWRTVRAPGTGLPGVLAAGTFYTEQGREFWYVTPNSPYLNLELKDEYYKRIVIDLSDNEQWVTQIRAAIR